jgi:beta-mannosidase
MGDNKTERYPQSRFGCLRCDLSITHQCFYRIMNNHNKADGFERRLELYLIENFKHAFDTERYVPDHIASKLKLD